MLTKRTQILLEPQTWEMLQQVAAAKNISIGETVRKAVKKTYSKKTLSPTQEVIKSIKSNWKYVKNPKKPIDYKALINHGRKF